MVATISGPTLGAVCAATGTLMASHDASSEPTRMRQRLALEAVMLTPLARGAGEREPNRQPRSCPPLTSPFGARSSKPLAPRPCMSARRNHHDLDLVLGPGELGFDGGACGRMAGHYPGIPHRVHLAEGRHVGQPDIGGQQLGLV